MSLNPCNSDSPATFDRSGSDRFDWTEPFKSMNGHSNPATEVQRSESSDALSSVSPVGEGDIFQSNESSQRTTSSSKPEMLDPVSRRKKKPKSLPKRPLSAYNFYFKRVRVELIQKEDTKIGFEELGKIVGKRWRELPETQLAEFQELAVRDTERYRLEMEEHTKRENSRKSERGRTSKATPLASKDPPQYLDPGSDPNAGANYPAHAGSPPQQGYSHASSGFQGNYHSFPQPPPYPSQMPWSGGHSPRYGQTPYYDDSMPTIQLTMDGRIDKARPLPPGSEVRIRDSNGELRTYTVQYSMVTMPRKEAEEYLKRLSNQQRNSQV